MNFIFGISVQTDLLSVFQIAVMYQQPGKGMSSGSYVIRCSDLHLLYATLMKQGQYCTTDLIHLLSQLCTAISYQYLINNSDNGKCSLQELKFAYFSEHSFIFYCSYFEDFVLLKSFSPVVSQTICLLYISHPTAQQLLSKAQQPPGILQQQHSNTLATTWETIAMAQQHLSNHLG